MSNERGHTVREQESVCVVDLAGRVANLEANLRRSLPWFDKSPEQTGRIAIVGSGPSVRSRLALLRGWEGEIWAVNGAYDYLLGEGITPQGFWGIDPLPGLADYVRNARSATTFYIAGTCDPVVLDALAGQNVKLWFPLCDDAIYPKGCLVVNGGTGVLSRAPCAAWLAGWRDITVFGADSSFDEEAEQRYCYRDGTYVEDSQADLQFVDIGGEIFITEINLIKQVSVFAVMQTQFAKMGARLSFDCDGLLAAFLKAEVHEIDEHGTVTGPNADWFYGTDRNQAAGDHRPDL